MTEELDEATRKKEIAMDLYHAISMDAENMGLFDKLEKAYEFMKQFVIGGRNMLDVFRERIGEVKEWVHRKVAGMSR